MGMNSLISLAKFIKENSTDQAVQEAVNELNIKIGGLAEERIKLLDTIGDLKSNVAELEDTISSLTKQQSQLSEFRLDKYRGLSFYVHKDESNVNSESEKYCPNCYKKGRLNQLSGVFWTGLIEINCSECGFTQTGH